MVINGDLPSGKHTKNYGTSQFSMGKSTMEITIFNSLVNVTGGYLGDMGFSRNGNTPIAGWFIQEMRTY